MFDAYVAIGVLGSMCVLFVVVCLIAILEYGPSCEERGESSGS